MRSVAPRFPKKGGRWSPKRIETTVGGVYPFGNRSRRPQAAKSQPGNGVLLTQLGCTGKRLPRNGLPPSCGVALTRPVCPGGRLLRKTCLPAASIGFSRCKQLFLTVHGSYALFCDSSRALYPIIFAEITKFLHFSQIFLTYIVI